MANALQGVFCLSASSGTISSSSCSVSFAEAGNRFRLSAPCSPTLSASSCSLFGTSTSSLDVLRGSYDTERWRQRYPRSTSLQVQSAAGPNDGVKWWEKDGGPNMMDVHSAKEFTDAITAAGEKLVVVEVFATWCGSCRALYPKLCRIAAEHTDVVFLKVNFDENKPLCKSLNIKVLPYFHIYRGAAGLLDAFSCSITKLQRLKDAIATHDTARCSTGPPTGLEIDGTESSRTGTLDKPATTGPAR